MYNLIYSFVAFIVLSFFKNKIFRHFSFFLLALLFSSRDEGIKDTNSYYLHYTQPYTTWVSDGAEPGFVLSNIFFGQILNISFPIYLFIITLFLMEVWYLCTKRLLPKELIGFCFLLFISYNGFFYLGVTLRNAMSLMICLIALMIYITSTSKYKVISYVLLVVLSFFFHRTSIFFLVVPILDYIKLTKKRLSYWLLADIAFLLMGGLTFLTSASQLFMGIENLSKYEDNFTDTEGVSMFSSWFLMNIIITLFLVYGRKSVNKENIGIYDFFLKIVMAGLTLNCIGWQMSIIQRLAGAFYYFNFIPLYMFFFKSKMFKNDGLKRRSAILFSVFCFIVLLYCQSFLLNY